MLPAAIHSLAAGRGLICPGAQGGEAAWAEGLEILAPPTLLALINHYIHDVCHEKTDLKIFVVAIPRPSFF